MRPTESQSLVPQLEPPPKLPRPFAKKPGILPLFAGVMTDTLRPEPPPPPPRMCAVVKLGGRSQLPPMTG